MFTEYPGLIVPFATTPLQTTLVGSVLEDLTARLEAAVGSRELAESGVHALNSLIIGGALDSLDPDTTPAHTSAAMTLGIESLIHMLRERRI